MPTLCSFLLLFFPLTSHLVGRRVRRGVRIRNKNRGESSRSLSSRSHNNIIMYDILYVRDVHIIIYVTYYCCTMLADGSHYVGARTYNILLLLQIYIRTRVDPNAYYYDDDGGLTVGNANCFTYYILCLLYYVHCTIRLDVWQSNDFGNSALACCGTYDIIINIGNRVIMITTMVELYRTNRVQQTYYNMMRR